MIATTRRLIIYAHTVFFLTACTTLSHSEKSYQNTHFITMRSSWYGGGEKLSRHTANGEVFRPDGKTAAHRTFPFGTRLHVCYNSCTVVRINDRGPAAWTGRSLDISRGAAQSIGLLSIGSAFVQVSTIN